MNLHPNGQESFLFFFPSQIWPTFSEGKYLFWWACIFNKFYFFRLHLQIVDVFRYVQYFNCWSDVLLLAIFNSFLWYKSSAYFHLFVGKITYIFNEDTTKPQLWLKSAPYHQTVLSPRDFQIIVNIHSNFNCIGESGDICQHFDSSNFKPRHSFSTNIDSKHSLNITLSVILYLCRVQSTFKLLQNFHLLMCSNASVFPGGNW